VPARSGIVPMKAVTGELPRDDGWAYEIKWDGYRAIAFVENGKVRLQSANLLDFTPRWPELAGLAADVHARQAVLDGEVMTIGSDGVPRFELLQRGELPVTYVVFDVLSVDGHDTTGLSYDERHRLLESLVDNGPHWLVTVSTDDGEALLAAAKERGLEGVMAKRRGSTYQIGKRSPAWRKVKVRREQELVIGGWTPGTGKRSDTFGAILVGYYEDGRLRYGGGVGTGFDRRSLKQLLARFDELATDECPFDPPPPRAVTRTAHWVRPELVAQVAFAEWTFEGIVRQASFLGLREDKAAIDVVREG
jgi:bifunctional non-homologous end joining protein LigD